MAKGRNAWTRRVLLVVAVSLYALLVASGVFPNPVPVVWAWIDEDRPLAPDLAWQERLTGRPEAATAAGDQLAIAAGNRGELRDLWTGRLRTPGDPPGWESEWVAVAGAGDAAVVVTGEGEGYQLRDSRTGAVLHEDEAAVSVWTYRDARLDLRCDQRRACQLRAYLPGSGSPEWTTDLPGRREGILGLNPQLATARTADPNRIDRHAGGPQPVPRMLGFPMERRGGDAVVVVETATGKVRQILEPESNEKIIVVGDRVIRSSTSRQNGICTSTVSGHDPVTGSQVWGPAHYHVWSTGACEQRTPPLSAGAALVVVGADGRPLVIDAYDGRLLWQGDAEESVVALSPYLAVIRPPDGDQLYGVALGGDGTPLWERRAEPDAEALVVECGVIVADRDPSRVYVWEPQTGDTKLSVPTTATVLACTEDGVVLAGGRSVAFAPFDGVEGGGGDSPDRDGDPAGDPDRPVDSK